ncbi:MAG: hypothetical protein NVS2B9_19390 [Myxococcales bacterium]
MLARCPSCRNTFRAVRTGRQDCPVCGRPLVVPEGPPAAPAQQESGTGSGPALPPIEEPSETRPGTPWERRASLGLWSAWTQTLSQALLEPGRLFASARLDRGQAQLGFAVVTVSVFWALGQILDRLLFSRQREQLQAWMQHLPGARNIPPWLQNLTESASKSSVRDTLFAALLSPALVFVVLCASAAVTHLCALLLRQNRRGFPATFAATAYAFAPLVLLAIPGCGGVIALVWCAVLTGFGLKATHGVSSKGAAASAIAPYVFFCCATCALSLAVGTVAARAFQSPG